MAQRVFNTPWVASDYAVCEYKAAACDTGYRPLTSDTSVKCVWADPDTCPQGFYCPEGSDEPIECPTDKNGIAATTEIGARTIEQCFIKYDPYSAFQNGTGSATCNYSNASRDYTNCHDIEAKTCNAGYYYRDSGSATCVGVVSGNYSPEPDIVQTPCPTGGSGSNQFAANWDACYKNCETTVAHSETVVAKIEKVFGISANAYATCEFHVTCEAGYSPTNNDTTNPTCGACPEGSYCESGNEEPTACPATHPYSAPNMTSVTGCYEKCEEYKLDGGTAIPRAEKVNYPARCEFYGISDRGNPCDIIDGTCIESSCSGDFEMIDGRCEPCNRENALAYKTIGNCMVASCINGFHPNGDKCESNVRECQAPNATIAEQRWDFTKNSFGTCTIVECDYGYHVASNACVADERVCAVEHGTGTQEWNSATNSWSECVATSCEPGYTNDPYETNEHTKQCGQCKNKFRVHGEQAASTYIQGCEIASCMYQGELYNLENNECVPICSIEGKEDETGTMKWDPVRKKCVRTCKEGYTMW